MKKINIITLCALYIIVTSCDRLHADLDCKEAVYSTSFEENKEIIEIVGIMYPYYYVSSGSFLVFNYTYEREQCDLIRDDEYYEILNFQINAKLSSFSFKNKEIGETRAFFYRDGAWESGERYKIDNGTLSGQKLSENEWKITVKFFVPDTRDTIVINNTFIKK